MKKLAFISGAVVINIVFLLIINIFFNENNLPLNEVEYFNGFDITLLFPSTGYGNFILLGSTFGFGFGLVYLNLLVVKTLKGQTITLS